MKTEKNFTIQGLRFLFALGVILSHCFFLENYNQSLNAWNSMIKYLAFVSFFFVVSGYFSYSSISINDRIAKFMHKKIIRIWPLHAIITILFLVYKIVLHSFETSFVNILKYILNFFLLQSFVPDISFSNGVNGVAWFLSSLLFCYFAGFFVIKYTKKTNKMWLLLLVASILLVFKVLIEIIFPDDNSIGYYFSYICPFAGLSDFLIGCIVYIVKDKIHLNTLQRTMLQIISLFSLILCVFIERFIPVNFSRSFFTLFPVCLIIFSFCKETKASRVVFGNKFFAFLGEVSFEIYLMHYLIISLLSERSFFVIINEKVSPFLTVFLLILIIIVSAYLYHFVFEKVFSIYKRRLKNGQSKN